MGPAGQVGVGVGVLAEATLSLREEEHAKKALGLCECLWPFSLTWPQTSESREDFHCQEAKTASHPVIAVFTRTGSDNGAFPRLQPPESEGEALTSIKAGLELLAHRASAVGTTSAAL